MSEQTVPPSPAVDLLTALTRGSEDAAVAVLSPDVVVALPQLMQRIEGSASVLAAWERVRDLFPDLEYRPHTRHVGSELVVDDATIVGTQTGGEQPTGRQLSTAVRVGVVHDGTTVQEITADIDLQPLRRALGKSVDAYALAVSEVQALRGVDREDMVTYRLEDPRPRSNERGGTDAAGSARTAGRRRRADAKVLVAVLLMVLAAGGGRWFLSQRGEAPAAAAVEQHPAAKPSPKAPAPPTDVPSPAVGPTATTPPPAKKPAVVLKSDLAFGFDSFRVSPAARSAVVRIAGQARAAGLAGTILVEGYTDNLGSAAYGRQLSQRRADAVARILRGHLKGTPLRVVSVGRGESHPIRSNTTAKGRASNRRVTIKLPSP